MKKILFLPLALLALTAAACGGTAAPERHETPDAPSAEGNRTLVVYCSRTGTTADVARRIGDALGCATVEVRPAVPYDEDYRAMLDRARREQSAVEQGVYPGFEAADVDFASYDLILIGYPIWYAHMATPMQSFLHAHAAELAGRRVALFATSGSSGIGSSTADARTQCPDARYEGSLSLTAKTLPEAQRLIDEWLERIDR